MIDQSSIVTVCSALISFGGITYITTMINKNNVANLTSKLTEFKADIKEEITREKRHAMELAQQRIGAIEKDIDEIFPRLRTTEDGVKKNCLITTKLLQEHDKLVCMKEREVRP